MYFVTFITEGYPYDQGFDLTEVGRDLKKRLSPYFDEIFVFTKRSLKELPNSQDICNSFVEELDNNINANHLGYFDFKPFIIKHVLKIVPKKSLVLYHDGNFKKNPHYFDSDWKNIETIANSLLLENQSDVWVQIEREITFVKEHVKRHTLAHVLKNEIEVELALNARLLNAARILVRNTAFAENFIDEYLYLCLNKDLVQKTPDNNRNIHAKNYCGDQDVLNALIFKYIFANRLIPEFPKYSFGDRVISLQKVVSKDGLRRGGRNLLLNDDIINYMKSGKKIIHINDHIPVSSECFHRWFIQEFKNDR